MKQLEFPFIEEDRPWATQVSKWIGFIRFADGDSGITDGDFFITASGMHTVHEPIYTISAISDSGPVVASGMSWSVSSIIDTVIDTMFDDEEDDE